MGTKQEDSGVRKFIVSFFIVLRSLKDHNFLDFNTKLWKCRHRCL